MRKSSIYFAFRINFLPLGHYIVLTILQFIGHLLFGWLAFTSPAQAQTTPQVAVFFQQPAQLEQTLALPFWKENNSSFWSYLSESLEESSAENEESHEGEPQPERHQALSAWHGRQARVGQGQPVVAAHNLPLYLQHCSLKIPLV